MILPASVSRRTRSEVDDPVDVTRFRRVIPRLCALTTIAVKKSFLFENFDRFPRFVGRSLFVFERALQIHLGQQIVGIEFQET